MAAPLLIAAALLTALALALCLRGCQKLEGFETGPLQLTYDQRIDKLCEQGWYVLRDPPYGDIQECQASPEATALRKNARAQPVLMDDGVYEGLLRSLGQAVRQALPRKYEERLALTCERGYGIIKPDPPPFATAAECKADKQMQMLQTDAIARAGHEGMIMDDTYYACALRAFGMADRDVLEACEDAWDKTNGV